MPGEGLREAIFRASSENCYLRCSDILSSVGIPGSHAAFVGSSSIGRQAILARLLGPAWSSARILEMTFRPVERSGWHTWFGTTIRKVHLLGRTRRVSPRSLVQSLHCKAIWGIKAFSFDPATNELLLASCPVCQKGFGYRMSLGVQFCDRCSRRDAEGFVRGAVDLRDFLQPLVQVEDEEALRFVTGLIDPDPEVRTNFSASLSDDLRDFDRGQIFELCIAIASALSADPKLPLTNSCGPLKGTNDYARLTPAMLSMAGRAVLDWPQGFRKLVEHSSSGSNQRPGDYGVLKVAGALWRLGTHSHVVPELRRVVRDELSREMATPSAELLTLKPSIESDLITLRKAKQSLRVGQASIHAALHGFGVEMHRADARKSPIIVRKAEMELAVQRARDTMRPIAMARQIGAPELALPTLARRGLLQKAKVKADCNGAGGYSRTSLDELRARIQAVCSGACPPPEAVRLYVAASDLGSAQRCAWGELLEAIIRGELRCWTKYEDAALGRAVVVVPSEYVGLEIQSDRWNEGETDPVLSVTCAATMLGIYPNHIHIIMRGGLMPRKIRLSDLQAFAQRYFFSRQVRTLIVSQSPAECNGSPSPNVESASIAPLLKLFGITPQLSYESGRVAIWDRVQVEALVDVLPQIREMIARR